MKASAEDLNNDKDSSATEKEKQKSSIDGVLLKNAQYGEKIPPSGDSIIETYDIDSGSSSGSTMTKDGSARQMVIESLRVLQERYEQEGGGGGGGGDDEPSISTTTINSKSSSIGTKSKKEQQQAEMLFKINRYQFSGVVPSNDNKSSAITTSSSNSIPLPQVVRLLESFLSGNSDLMRSVLLSAQQELLNNEPRRLSVQSSPTTTSATAQCTVSLSSSDYYQNDDIDDDVDDDGLLSNSNPSLNNYHQQKQEETEDDVEIDNHELFDDDDEGEEEYEESEEDDNNNNHHHPEHNKWIVSSSTTTSDGTTTSRHQKDHHHQVLGRLSSKSGGTTGVVLDMADDFDSKKDITSNSKQKTVPPPPPRPALSVFPPPPPREESPSAEEQDMVDEEEEEEEEDCDDEEVDECDAEASGEDDDDDEEEEEEEDDDDDEEDDGMDDAPREGYTMMKFLCHNLLKDELSSEEEVVEEPTPPPPEMSAIALFMPFPHLHLEEFEHFSNPINNKWNPLRRIKDDNVYHEQKTSASHDNVGGSGDDDEEEDDDEDEEDIELGYSKWRFTQDEIEVIEEEYDWYKQYTTANETTKKLKTHDLAQNDNNEDDDIVENAVVKMAASSSPNKSLVSPGNGPSQLDESEEDDGGDGETGGGSGINDGHGEEMFLFDSENLQQAAATSREFERYGGGGGESDEDAIVSSTITPLDQLSIMSGEDSDDEEGMGGGASSSSGLHLYKLGCSHRELARSFSDDYDDDDDDDEDGMDEDGLIGEDDYHSLTADYSEKDMEDALNMLENMPMVSSSTCDNNSITAKSHSSSSDHQKHQQGLGSLKHESTTTTDGSRHEPSSRDETYVEFSLPIVYEPHKTGLEPSPNLTLVEGTMVAGRYQVVAELGSAAFSTAYHCVDMKATTGNNSNGSGSSSSSRDGHHHGVDVCLKVIQNSKDFLDQSLDEIKVLQTIQHGTNKGGFSTTTTSELCDENHVLHLQRYFYYREHLILVTELLQDNLYEFDKTLREAGQPRYFTLKRLCYVTKQVLLALDYVHSLDLIHCDVKPENIMMWSYRSARVKLIDFGSACYSTDRLSSYIQSRSYRAPEVVLGLPYNSKIDIWSLGGVIAELYTGHVLFQNESVIGMLARMEAICGPFPQYMKENGKKSSSFFLASGLICERIRLREGEEAEAANILKSKKLDHRRLTKQESERLLRKYQCYDVYRPKTTSLEERLGLINANDESEILFVDFMKQMLSLDPKKRPSAREALNHPWIQRWGSTISEKDLKYRPKVAGFA